MVVVVAPRVCHSVEARGIVFKLFVAIVHQLGIEVLFQVALTAHQFLD
jgi:hypothetical protein